MDAATVHRLNQFIPEAAKMTVIFVNVDFKQFDRLPILILQQVALYRYEGSLNKLTYDDKGATAVAVFGLPPICNFDDAALQIEKVLKSQIKEVIPALPEHAAQAAKLRDELSQRAEEAKHSGLRKVSIGVTSGRVYCGLLGSGGSGCEYGVLGDLVNMSVRLMQHAGKSKEKGVLVSKETQIQCDNCRNLRFEKLKPIQVKGKSAHIEVLRPTQIAVEGETIIYKSRYNVSCECESRASQTIARCETMQLRIQRSEHRPSNRDVMCFMPRG